MSGDELKGILKKHKVKITELAKTLDMSQPNLSAALNAIDIKSGLIEKIASATNIPISELYGLTSHSVNNISSHATGNGQASVNIGSNSVTDIYIKYDYRKVDAANRKIIDYINSPDTGTARQ